MKKIFLLTISAALFMVVFGSFAQDDTAYTPDPGTPQDNECFEGGDWYGSCTTEWHWVCGWYLARHTDGVFGYEQLPTWCHIPEPPPPPEPQWNGTGSGASCPTGLTQAQSLASCNLSVGSCVVGVFDATGWWTSCGAGCSQWNYWATPDANGCYPK